MSFTDMLLLWVAKAFAEMAIGFGILLVFVLLVWVVNKPPSEGKK